eukprot:GHVU01035153.1.p2 GENE.GHVU01035153.1~~GHVU01035153.1.p2  ORF type:complete len:110 (-),score=1.88 GHVU01035153.1:48-377(-)
MTCIHACVSGLRHIYIYIYVEDPIRMHGCMSSIYDADMMCECVCQVRPIGRSVFKPQSPNAYIHEQELLGRERRPACFLQRSRQTHIQMSEREGLSSVQRRGIDGFSHH